MDGLDQTVEVLNLIKCVSEFLMNKQTGQESKDIDIGIGRHLVRYRQHENELRDAPAKWRLIHYPFTDAGEGDAEENEDGAQPIVDCCAEAEQDSVVYASKR